MTPFSICIIAKNEEKNILSLFTSIQEHLKDYPYEIIFVDTGFTDNTKILVSAYTDKIYDFTWINDFSAARNFSISVASHDWVLILDCDEYVTDIDILSINDLISSNPNGIGMITRMDHYKQGTLDYIYNAEIPRFFSRKYFHYEGIIHEQVTALNNNDFQRFSFPLTLSHVGYIGTEEELSQKAQRNIYLLQKTLEDNPEDTYIYYQLGQTYNSIYQNRKSFNQPYSCTG